MLDEKELKWIREEGCKQFTAKELSDKYCIDNVRMHQILKKNGITALKARDRLKIQLTELHAKDEFTSLNEAAELFGVDKKTVQIAASELGIAPKTTLKVQADAENRAKKEDKNETRRLVEIAIESGLIKPKNNTITKTLPFGVPRPRKDRVPGQYTQTGSELLDELRGIKTTERAATLLTNNK